MKWSAPSSNPLKRRSALAGALILLSCLAAAGAALLLSRRGDARAVLVSGPDGSQLRLDVSALEGQRLSDAVTGREEVIRFDSENTLLVLMSPGDCPNCLRERSVWESLSRGHEASRLRVVGILLRTSPEEALAFARAYRLPFPLYLDRENQLRRVTELPPLTPFKVLVNSRGEVLLADGPNPNATARWRRNPTAGVSSPATKAGRRCWSRKESRAARTASRRRAVRIKTGYKGDQRNEKRKRLNV